MFNNNYTLKYFLLAFALALLFIAALCCMDLYYNTEQIRERNNILYSYTVGGTSRSGVIVQAICNKKTDKCLCFNENTMESFPCPE